MSIFAARVLILVPHPDDEVVGFCAAIGRAQTMGAKIFALYLSHGCIAKEDLWPWQRLSYDSRVAKRLSEAEEVANLLGITPTGFSNRPTRRLRRELPAVAKEILKSVSDYAIDQIWVPAYEGGHADHDALNGLCAKMKVFLPPVLEFSEYHFANKEKHAQDFIAPNGTEAVLRLSPKERMFKEMVLGLYASEKKNLDYVQTEKEVYRPLAAYDYAKPPHEGPLWYARFQWVPFRHPRVDFARPEEISAALAAFEPASVLPESARRPGPERKE